jgi:hypothetical protein
MIRTTFGNDIKSWSCAVEAGSYQLPFSIACMGIMRRAKSTGAVVAALCAVLVTVVFGLVAMQCSVIHGDPVETCTDRVFDVPMVNMCLLLATYGVHIVACCCLLWSCRRRLRNPVSHALRGLSRPEIRIYEGRAWIATIAMLGYLGWVLGTERQYVYAAAACVSVFLNTTAMSYVAPLDVSAEASWPHEDADEQHEDSLRTTHSPSDGESQDSESDADVESALRGAIGKPSDPTYGSSLPAALAFDAALAEEVADDAPQRHNLSPRPITTFTASLPPPPPARSYGYRPEHTRRPHCREKVTPRYAWNGDDHAILTDVGQGDVGDASVTRSYALHLPVPPARACERAAVLAPDCNQPESPREAFAATGADCLVMGGSARYHDQRAYEALIDTNAVDARVQGAACVVRMCLLVLFVHNSILFLYDATSILSRLDHTIIQWTAYERVTLMATLVSLWYRSTLASFFLHKHVFSWCNVMLPRFEAINSL